MVDSILTEILDVSQKKKKKKGGSGSIVYFQFKKKIRLGIFEDVLSCYLPLFKQVFLFKLDNFLYHI